MSSMLAKWEGHKQRRAGLSRYLSPSSRLYMRLPLTLLALAMWWCVPHHIKTATKYETTST